MSGQLMRIAARTVRISHRALGTAATTTGKEVAMEQPQKDKIYPKIGNRDVVGYGFNGTGSYADREEFPCPAIRFKENTPDVLALRMKEKGDWKKLTLEEKKELYRASFCQTFAEMKAPTGEWKSVTAAVLLALSVSAWFIMWMKTYVYLPMPRTLTAEWQHEMGDRMLNQRQGRVTGFTSNYDLEKGQWK
ncbi:cytochrome c oxidase subunit 4 isoform 1, mitochondrial-like [Gigantopelta aegis]|uniref:cytochrome c oxidase subunit 4 isoform 1, mitochondrial-like n=1 Tax=Gigantopelta aegis TaxID=1735272 RepID=UPI001B8892D9|nr:cytochrome c oxidase subunit 4 isoform 1, mitochondrial-like [Gigantopelta aegis]